MFTLSFPVKLPGEHTFFDNGQYPIPPLPGGLSFRCFSNENAPLVLQISGFATEQDAMDFCPILRSALRVAALDCEHSVTPSVATPTLSIEKHFDGSVPTVTPTKTGAMPYHTTTSMQTGLHISVLSKLVGTSLAQGSPAKVNGKPELALSLELYSDCQFAGERNAQFIVLMTALEILVPKASAKGKRGKVIGLVKQALSRAGHSDPKSAGKVLDALYVARNALLHEAKPVTDPELADLKDIVRCTLKALIE
ncbi:MAG: hypothetical protein V3R74_09900 [Alphaproteobacteria bacterium]